MRNLKDIKQTSFVGIFLIIVGVIIIIIAILMALGFSGFTIDTTTAMVLIYSLLIFTLGIILIAIGTIANKTQYTSEMTREIYIANKRQLEYDKRIKENKK